MMKKKIKQIINKRSGMTLVESLVGMALVVLFGAGIFASIMLAQRVIIRGDKLEHTNQENIAVTAKAGNTDFVSDTQVRVTVEGTVIAITGDYKVSGNAGDIDNPSNVISFEVNET